MPYAGQDWKTKEPRTNNTKPRLPQNRENHERNQQAMKAKKEEEEGISADLLALTNQLTNKLSAAAANTTHPQPTLQDYTQVADASTAAIEKQAVERVRSHNNKGANALTEVEIKKAVFTGTTPSAILDSGASDTCIKTKEQQMQESECGIYK